VCVIESSDDLVEQAERHINREGRLLLDDRVERPPFDELHRNGRHPGFLDDVVDGDDVGMGERAGRAGVAIQGRPKVTHLLVVVAEQQGLEGDRATDDRIFALVDDGHGAAPQLFDDLIAADRLYGWRAVFTLWHCLLSTRSVRLQPDPRSA